MTIQIHSTKKLYAKLPLNAEGKVISKRNPLSVVSDAATSNPLSGWHANLLNFQRRNSVILVHDATRFPLFITGLLKADFAEFDWHFTDTFMNTLLKLGANQQQMERAESLLAPCRIDHICDRSVQGTMNRMAGDIEHMLWYDNLQLQDISAYRTGAWLADRPCTVKGLKDFIWPKKAMLALLSESQ